MDIFVGRYHTVKVGDEHGQWRVIDILGGRPLKVKARCLECGNDHVRGWGDIRRGGSSRCSVCANKSPRPWKRIHGMSHSPERQAHNHMNQRCYNPNDSFYKDYGARGIKVCERWRYSFVDFLTDMGPKPSSKHSLDRIDASGNYEPGNCRWATPRQQSQNRRTVRHLEFDGQSHCINEWARRTGINRTTIAARLAAGLSVEDALTKPVLARK